MKIRCLFNIKKRVPFMLRGKNEYVCKGLNILEVVNLQKDFESGFEGEFKRHFIVEPVEGVYFKKEEVMEELNYLLRKASDVID